MDLRNLIKVLEEKGLLHRVKEPVDKEWELSCVARQVAYQPAARRYGLVFEKPKGYDIPVAVNLFASRQMYMAALGVDTIEDVYAKWYQAQSKPLPPVVVKSGPCKENILTGDQVDLTRFPIPTWTPGLDPAPYISAGCVVIKDPETGIRNVGTYRMMLKGKNKLGILILPSKDAGIIYSKYEAMNKPMEVAIVLGPPPTVCMTSVGRVPYGLDELAVSGALAGKALDVVRCETVDLEVPADAEIVIEGVVPPKEREHEGPFGEFAGFMGPAGERPFVRVTAVTHRNQPIYQAFLEQKPPSEGAVLKDVVQEGILLNALKNLGIPGVKKIYVTEAGAQYNVIVAIRKMHPGHVKRVMQGCWAAYAVGCKLVIVVEEDCDVYDPRDVDWHLATRVQPARDVVIMDNCTGHSLDPSMPVEQRAWGSKMGIDATKKIPYPSVSLPPQEMLDKVKGMWSKYGLPKL
jgi:2,5-furandicarboxylate decarboxylase 1